MRALLLVAALAAGSCEGHPDTPPNDGDGTCETAGATLQKLGGCGLDMKTYVQNCRDREKAEAKFGAKSAETCITKSTSCAQAFGCK